jgi:hypothetical protein
MLSIILLTALKAHLKIPRLIQDSKAFFSPMPVEDPAQSGETCLPREMRDAKGEAHFIGALIP